MSILVLKLLLQQLILHQKDDIINTVDVISAITLNIYITGGNYYEDCNSLCKWQKMIPDGLI